MNRRRRALVTVVFAAACTGERATETPPPGTVLPTPAAHVQTREPTYWEGDTALQGFIAWPAGGGGRRPGVLVVHEWWGHNRHARDQAVRLAEAGYVGFALDVYGKGRVTTDHEDAEAFAREALKNPALLRARFQAALDTLKKDPHVDPDRIAAVGYCFGGAVVLAMARAGMDLDAVATLHGALATRNPARPGAVKPRILVLHGAEDPLVTMEQVEAFKNEMDSAGATYEVVVLPGAQHSFTNPDADKEGMKGVAFHADADRRSWELLLRMLRDVFGA